MQCVCYYLASRCVYEYKEPKVRTGADRPRLHANVSLIVFSIPVVS